MFPITQLRGNDNGEAHIIQYDLIRFLVRCTMKNDKDHAVWVGTTRDDEMCNFYLMYWMHGPKNLDQGGRQRFHTSSLRHLIQIM